MIPSSESPFSFVLFFSFLEAFLSFDSNFLLTFDRHRLTNLGCFFLLCLSFLKVGVEWGERGKRREDGK